MARRGLYRHVGISDDERTVATAEVTSQGPGGTARVSLHAESGHITPGRRASLVDAVLALPEVQESAHLKVVFPLGDCETLQRLQERCLEVRTHPAGGSAIMEANLPSGRGAPLLTGQTTEQDGPPFRGRVRGTPTFSPAYGLPETLRYNPGNSIGCQPPR